MVSDSRGGLFQIANLTGYSTVGSSIWASGRDQVAARFHTSTIVSVLPLVFFNAGMGLGPLIASPLSETFGRRAVYLIVMPLFCLFVLGTGFADSMAAIIVCRFFAGMFASPSVAIAAATIADMYAVRERAIPLFIYYNSPTIGAYFGYFLLHSRCYKHADMSQSFHR